MVRARRPLLAIMVRSGVGVIDAHGGAVQLEAGRAMNETIEDSVREGRILQLSMPVGDRQLGGDDDRAAAEAVVEDFEEISAACGFDGRQAPVVEDQEVDAGEVSVELGDGTLAMGDAQIVEQPRHAQIEGLEPFETGLVGEGARDPALAGAARTCDQDRGAVMDPRAIAEAEHDG